MVYFLHDKSVMKLHRGRIMESGIVAGLNQETCGKGRFALQNVAMQT